MGSHYWIKTLDCESQLYCVLFQISAADERRRASGATSDAYMSEFISYPDLRDRIASRCPPDTLIPSVSTLRLATAPANPYCARAQAFSGILDIKHKVQVGNIHGCWLICVRFPTWINNIQVDFLDIEFRFLMNFRDSDRTNLWLNMECYFT